MDDVREIMPECVLDVRKIALYMCSHYIKTCIIITSNIIFNCRRLEKVTQTLREYLTWTMSQLLMHHHKHIVH